MKVGILESARKDLVDGYYFYEKQAEGIGKYFLESHRLLSERFPFAVYYCVDGETAFVYAVLDCRRKPAWIRAALS